MNHYFIIFHNLAGQEFLEGISEKDSSLFTMSGATGSLHEAAHV